MKLTSFLLVAICGVASVFTASFLQNEGLSIQIPKLEEEFVLVEIDLKGSTDGKGMERLVKSTVYPKFRINEEIQMEFDRIKGRFDNGKMTEAAIIDLLVLMYQLFSDRLGTSESKQKLFNEFCQLAIEFPNHAFSHVSNSGLEVAESCHQFLQLHSHLSAQLRISDINGFEAAVSKFREPSVRKGFNTTFDLKTVDGVKAIFDQIYTLPSASPLNFLKELPLNLNIRNYLRFFMCVYAASLQSNYKRTHHFERDLYMLFYDSASVFLRAFPEEIVSSELAGNLGNILSHCRGKIVENIGHNGLKFHRTMLEGIDSGLHETVALLMSLEPFSQMGWLEMASCCYSASNAFQFKIFTKLYQAWSPKLSNDLKIDRVFMSAVAKVGISNFINEQLAEKFSREEWKALLKVAARNRNMNAVKALLRASMLDKSVLNELDLDLNSIFNEYIMEHNDFVSESHVIEIILLFPGLTLQFNNLKSTYPRLAALQRNYHFDSVTAKLSILNAYAQCHDYGAISILFVTLVDRIGHYHFRKLMSHLNPNDCPELVRMVLAELGSKSGYIEEAAYGALEASNVDLLGLLVDSYSFKISETFAKRWAIKCQIDSNYAKLLEFQARFT